MIDHRLLRRLLLLSGALLLISTGAALAIWRSPALAGGLALGAVLGAAPFASWAWIASRGLATRASRILAAVLVLGKLAAYSGALYLLVTKSLVEPVGIFIGLTAVVAVFTVGVLAGARTHPRVAL
jgi:hypothetical protein